MKKSLIMFIVIIMLLMGCSSKDANSIVIASKPMTEQYIITEMMKILIEEGSDIEVNIKQGIGGGTSNIHPALLKGEIDIYPEYTGTAWMFVLKKDNKLDRDVMFESIKEEYREKFNLEWIGLMGFNNTYALAIREDLSSSMEIETYSDLVNVSDQLVFGGEYDFFEREDGFKGLVEHYEFQFASSKEMDIGLKYMAIDQREVDVINGFSTDGRLKEYGMKVLRDDKGFFPSYYCGTVIRKDILKEYPELQDILSKMNNLISEEDMIEMNYLVEVESMTPLDVAKAYLIEKGMFVQ